MTSRKVRKAQLLAYLLGTCMLTQACKGNHSATVSEVKPSEEKNASTSSPQQEDVQSPEDRTLISVSKAIRTAHLTDLSDVCLAYRFDQNASGSAYLVDVRENHRDTSCGGDPQTQPHLFTVKVDKRTNKMWTDQSSPGVFRPID